MNLSRLDAGFYNSEMHSYRDLPIRMAELGLVHRHEFHSSTLHGLMRVRSFTSR